MGEKVIFLLPSVSEDQLKAFFYTTKRDKVFCQTSTEVLLSLLVFFQVTGKKNSTMYGPAVHLKLLLLNYLEEKAQGCEFLSRGPHLKGKMTWHSGEVHKHSGKVLNE